jgi:hypothetical protein
LPRSPLEEYVAGYVIEMWASPRALNIAQSDDDRMERIGRITSEMAHLREQKNETLRMKLRGTWICRHTALSRESWTPPMTSWTGSTRV